MHELVGVRLYNIGPPQSPFNATIDLRLISPRLLSSDASIEKVRSASSATLILGDNGIGKSSLAGLLRSVLDPTVLHSPKSARLDWRVVGPSAGVGQVVLKWRETKQARTFFTALAVERASDSSLRFGYFIVRPASDVDFDLLIPDPESSTLADVRDHLEKFASSQQGTGFVWANTFTDWHEKLEALALGPSSVCLINGDPSQMWMNSGDGLVDELTQLLVSREELGELEDLAQLHSKAPDDVVGRAALRSNLAQLAAKVLDGLALFGRLSEWAPTELDEKRLLVNCAFSKATLQEIEDRIRKVLDPEGGIYKESGYSLLRFAVRAATVNPIHIYVYPPGSNGRFIDIDKMKFCSGGERKAISTILQLLLVRLAVVSQGRQQSCVVLLDECFLPEAREFRYHAKILASWGFQAIYFSAHAFAGPSMFESLLGLHSVSCPGNNKWYTAIVQAATLDTLRGGETKNDLIAGMATVPVAEVFEVHSEASDVKSGDFFLPAIRRVGDQRSVWIADNNAERAEQQRSVITLRPRKPLRPGEELFYASYLGSDKFLGEEVSPGQLVLVRANELAQIFLPKADHETLRAITELTAAAASFEEWRSDAHVAVDSFFQWQDLATARADIIETGRLTRQRHEAAQVLANRGPRFRATLPYPIARRWRDVEASSTGDSGYRSIIDCAEVTITYSAALGLAFAMAHSITVPRLRAVASKLQSGRTGPAFGDWGAVLNNLAEIALSTTEPADSPLRYYYRYCADNVKGAIRSLKSRRNDLAHNRGPSAHEMSARIVDARAELEIVLCASEWLVDYPLRYLEAERWDSFCDTSALTYRELMGDHNVVSLGRDDTVGHLESCSLYAIDQFGRYYLLRPYLHGEYCNICGQLGVFAIDGWNPAEQEAEYKAMDHPHIVRVNVAPLGLRAAGLLPSAQT